MIIYCLIVLYYKCLIVDCNNHFLFVNNKEMERITNDFFMFEELAQFLFAKSLQKMNKFAN